MRLTQQEMKLHLHSLCGYIFYYIEITCGLQCIFQSFCLSFQSFLLDNPASIRYNNRNGSTGGILMDRRKRIVLIMPEIIDPSDYELIQGVHSQAQHFGMDVLIITGIFNSQIELQQDDYIHALENIYTLIADAELDGILLASDRFRNQPLIRRICGHLEKQKAPVLALGDNNGVLPTLHAKQQEGMYRMTKHLIEAHGCRKLWCITGTAGSHASAERTEGFRRAMRDAGLMIHEDRIFHGNFWKDVPAQIGSRIASGELERPDAVVCASDVMAVALIESLEAGGIHVPEDIAVTGYDDGWHALFRDLTTISGRDQQLGADAVCRLCQMMGMSLPERSEFSQALNLRTSCGCSSQKLKWRSGFSIKQHFERKITHLMYKQEFLVSNLVKCFTAVESLEDWIVQADQSVHILNGVQGLDLCLCTDWKIDFDNPETFRQYGYSDTMLLALSKRPGKNARDQYRFPTRDILPALTVPHEPLLAVITSLSFGTQIMGYAASYYENAEDIRLDNSYVNWCDAAANGLNVLQNKQYQHYQRERIEHLAVRDPVTGFLNRRGFAEALPDFMSECRKQRQTAYVTVLGCGTSDAAGYDTALLLANSLRSIVPETAILCREEEQVFLVLAAEPLASLKEDAVCTMADLLGRQLRPPELLTVSGTIRSDVLSEQIIEIQILIEDLQKQIKFHASHFSNYRDALRRMRLRIIDQPQRNWTTEEIAKEIGISQSHLQRLYRELFGTSLMEDLISARIQMAEYLLMHTDLRVTEIAVECGYHSETHFMRQFKKRKNMTPTQFREQT